MTVLLYEFKADLNHYLSQLTNTTIRTLADLIAFNETHREQELPYFNQELFGGPTSLPWGLEISPAHRPPGYARYTTFHPTFLYELIFDLLLAAALVWLGRHRGIRPPGLFALYVAGYSAFRIFEESLRIDSSVHVLGLRLNFYIATALAVAGIAWFVRSQRRPPTGPPAEPASPVPTNATET